MLLAIASVSYCSASRLDMLTSRNNTLLTNLLSSDYTGEQTFLILIFQLRTASYGCKLIEHFNYVQNQFALHHCMITVRSSFMLISGMARGQCLIECRINGCPAFATSRTDTTTCKIYTADSTQHGVFVLTSEDGWNLYYLGPEQGHIKFEICSCSYRSQKKSRK